MAPLVVLILIYVFLTYFLTYFLSFYFFLSEDFAFITFPTLVKLPHVHQTTWRKKNVLIQMVAPIILQ